MRVLEWLWYSVWPQLAILLDQLHNDPTIFPVMTPLWYTSSAQSCRNLEPKNLVSSSVSTARWTGKEKRKKLEGSQKGCPVPSSSLELTSAAAVLVAAKLLLSNVIISSQGASFLFLNDNFIFVFYLLWIKVLFLKFIGKFWKIGKYHRKLPIQ